MKTKLSRTLIAAFAFAGLAMAQATVLSKSARADDEVRYMWGISNLGETCGGKCGVNNLCCKIVVVGPAALAEHVAG